MNKEIKTLEDLENFCKKNTGHGMNVPPFVYTDKYFEDIEKAYGNGYRAGYKEGFDYSIGEAELEEVKKSITPQPCCDCINRQAAIDTIDKWIKSMHVLIALPANEVTPLFESVHELPSVTPQPCDDAISRQAVMKLLNEGWRKGVYPSGAIMALPSVTPQPKMGQWIREKTIYGWDGKSYQCSECGRSIHLDTAVEDITDYPYCHCGAEMEADE